MAAANPVANPEAMALAIPNFFISIPLSLIYRPVLSGRSDPNNQQVRAVISAGSN
jgi:hypothetical protein